MACLLQTLGGTLGGRSGRPLTHSSYTTNWDTTVRADAEADLNSFDQELFKSLAGVHEAIYGCRPVTRQKTGDAFGGSIQWAKAIIRHAADAIEASPQSVPSRFGGGAEGSAVAEAQYLAEARRMAKPYVARLRDLAALSDRRIGDLLDKGWRDWKLQVAGRASPAPSGPLRDDGH